LVAKRRRLALGFRDGGFDSRIPPTFGMPIFLDTHHGSEITSDEIRQFLLYARSGTQDEFGVRPLDVYCGEDGRVFYVVASPDEDSVRRRHAARDVICRRVRQVETPSSAADELGDEEKTTVRHMIAAEHAWPADLVAS
jgi:hypothetical protein